MKLKILTIIISLLTLIFLGLIYAWSIFVVPLENEFGWSRSETSLTFTISIMAFCLSMMFGGFFNGKKDKPLVSLIIAAILIAGILFGITRRMSVASLGAALAYPLLIWHFAPDYLYFSIAAAAFLMVMHMANIKRIAKGEEEKLTIGGNNKTEDKEQTK